MNIFNSYKKAKAVVTSCDDARQLKGAKRYINFWFRAHSDNRKGNVYYASNEVYELYERLNKLLYIQKHKLNKYID